MENYAELEKRKKELEGRMDEVREQILLRSKEKDINNLQKLRASNEFWANKDNESIGRYNSWVETFKKEKKELEEENAKLKKSFFSRLFNSSKISKNEKEITRLEEQIAEQEKNVEENELKAESHALVTDTLYNQSDIWAFLSERGLTEETFKEKLATIPDSTTLSETLGELENEYREVTLVLAQNQYKVTAPESQISTGVPTATPEEIDRIISSYVTKHDDNDYQNNISIKPQPEVVTVTGKDELDKYVRVKDSIYKDATTQYHESNVTYPPADTPGTFESIAKEEVKKIDERIDTDSLYEADGIYFSSKDEYDKHKLIYGNDIQTTNNTEEDQRGKSM